MDASCAEWRPGVAAAVRAALVIGISKTPDPIDYLTVAARQVRQLALQLDLAGDDEGDALIQAVVTQELEAAIREMLTTIRH